MGGDPLICGIDAGTSRIRAMVFRANGELVAGAERPTPVNILGEGRAEHDIEDLTGTAFEALREALSKLENPLLVRSIAVASMGEAGTLVDCQGQSLTPVISWYDTRTTSDLLALYQRISKERIHLLTGLCADPTFSLLKLLWHKRENPNAFDRAAKWLHIADYLAFRLSGEMATDTSLASRTMMLDLKAGKWCDEISNAAGIRSGLMAALCPMGMALGPVRAEMAAEFGLDPACIIGTGGHDHVAGAVAVGADKAGTLLDSMGTAEALSLAQAAPLFDQDVGKHGFNQGLIHIEERSWYLFGGLPTSGGAIEWFRKEIANGRDHAALIEQARLVPPGCHGTGFMPHLRLGSPPHPDPVARGGFFGIGADIDEAVLYRATLEGVALDVAHILKFMAADPPKSDIERIIAIGGSTRNDLLMAIKASLFGRPIEIASMPEVVCLGAALLGGLAAGVYGTLAEAQSACCPQTKIVEPSSSMLWGEADRLLDIYGRRYDLFRKLN